MSITPNFYHMLQTLSITTFVTTIIAEIWKKKVIPPTWEKASAILIHKKSSTNKASNFRPITL